MERELIVDDARHYINTVQKQYDAIVIDAYSNIASIPAHLLTQEYMSEIKRKLSHKVRPYLISLPPYII